MNNKPATQGTASRIKPWFPNTASSNIQDLNMYRNPMHMIPNKIMPNKMDHRQGQSFTQESIAAAHNLLHGSSQDFFRDRQKLSGFWGYPHRVSIGLAQPLRRNTPDERKNEPQESAQTTSPSQHESQQQQNSSPPIDITDIDSAGNRKINKKKPGYVPMKKLKKWSHQCASLEASDPGANGADNDHLMAKRKPQEARLTYQPVPGAGGQTKLVFH
ncbi:uncharacterized protein LOC112574246 [Pomacea canaliculata]|uniref:uncharacterized protein LOC112574246 n=1 Tax=Pomacea canaliculata TaxID=400727 RepID=UPI000D73D31E|nr:uncharacterized protein LOC112574246 [Pomacea canaliculata]